MSVIFAFKPDSAEIARLKLHGSEYIFADFLVFHYLMMPTRLRIGDAEMLGTPSGSGWSRMALINTCITFVSALDSLRSIGHVSFDPGEFGDEALTFATDQGSVRATTDMGASGLTTIDDLTRAILDFDGAARAYILSEAPELERHADIGPWLLGTRSEPWRVQLP